ELGVLDQRLVELGEDVAGGDAVDVQPVLGPVGRHAAGKVGDRGLARGVGGDGGAGEVAHDRADVDDLAAAASDHPLGYRLADGEDGSEVGGDDLVEPILGEILERSAMLHAGIVDEDVDGPDVALGKADGLADAVGAGDVESECAHGGAVV